MSMLVPLLQLFVLVAWFQQSQSIRVISTCRAFVIVRYLPSHRHCKRSLPPLHIVRCSTAREYDDRRVLYSALRV
eukprot:12610510-Prorocentrum_lima.AAC.1